MLDKNAFYSGIQGQAGPQTIRSVWSGEILGVWNILTAIGGPSKALLGGIRDGMVYRELRREINSDR